MAWKRLRFRSRWEDEETRSSLGPRALPGSVPSSFQRGNVGKSTIVGLFPPWELQLHSCEGKEGANLLQVTSRDSSSGTWSLSTSFKEEVPLVQAKEMLEVETSMTSVGKLVLRDPLIVGWVTQQLKPWTRGRFKANMNLTPNWRVGLLAWSEGKNIQSWVLFFNRI